jgi:hypothetical protein
MTNISLGQTINGSLSSTDDVNPKRSGGFLDQYTLDGLSDWQQVQVSLDSTAIDSYLQLINASTGRQIIFDDNSGGNLNSKLSFTKIPGVNYILWATSANSEQTGNYTFKTSSLGTASSLVVTRNGQEAGTVDPLGRFVSIGSFVEAGSNSRFVDIAFSNDNKLLGIKSDSFPTQLYKINPETGSSSVIGNFPSGVEMIALESSPSNILYGASRSNGSNKSKLYTINPQTGAASSIANFPWDEGLTGDIIFDPVNNRFLFAKGSDSNSSLFSVSLTGQSTKIGDIGFGDVYGLSFEGNTLVGFTNDNKRLIINPATGKGTFDRNITGLTDGYTISGAGSIPSATRTTTPTVPTPTPPTSTPNNTQQPSTNSSSISITSASDLADGDKTLIPGGTIVVSGLGTGINTGSSNLNDFLFDNLKVFLGDIPIPLTGISSTVGSNPVQFGTNITLPNNISPGNYPLKLVLNTGTGSSISGVGPTLGIIPANATGAVKADFAVNSTTDQKLKRNIATPNVSAVPTGITALTNALSAVNIKISIPDVNARLQEASDKFPYGYLPDDLLIKDDLGKLDPSQRNVNLKFVPESSTQANKTWIVIHGWNVSADDNPSYAGDFSDLGKAVAQANPDDRVLLLDWKEAAAGGKLNDKESDPLGALALLRLGNYTAAKWIRPIAEWVVEKLEKEFGVDAEYASKNLNLIGHSLGSLLSNEIARLWQEKQTKAKQGIDPNGKGRGVNTIFVLDPPSQLSLSVLSLEQPGFGYDIDGRTPVMDFISPESGDQQIYLPNFKEVSNFSRAFVGKNSLAGNQIFAAQADESFQMSFSDRDRDRNDTGQEHLWVVEAFKNLIIQKNELADIGKLVNPSPILTDLKGKEKAYDNRHAGILAFNTPTIETKDLKDDKDLPKPLFLTVKNKDGGNLDDIVYGTNKKDTIVLDVFDDIGINSQGSLRYNSGLGNDIIYGKAEDDLMFGGSGNDTIRGDLGNDSINGQKDNDILFGDADDDIIWGGKEDDTLIGGKGKDTLTGGLGSDIFVFSPGDGAASRDEADIITDFGTGFIVGGGADRIGLAGGLKADSIELETFGGGIFGIGERTALKIKADGQYLAVLNSKFSASDLNFLENFSIV